MSRSAWGLTLTRADLDWRQQGRCSPDNAEAFFVGSTGRVLTPANQAALALCDTCPVIQQCHDHAATHPEHDTRIAGGKVWRGSKYRSRCR